MCPLLIENLLHSDGKLIKVQLLLKCSLPPVIFLTFVHISIFLIVNHGCLTKPDCFICFLQRTSRLKSVERSFECVFCQLKASLLVFAELERVVKPTPLIKSYLSSQERGTF